MQEPPSTAERRPRPISILVYAAFAFGGLVIIGAFYDTDSKRPLAKTIELHSPRAENLGENALNERSSKPPSDNQFEGNANAQGHQHDNQSQVHVATSQVVIPERLPSLLGMVTTHHKTGTHLFADILYTLCSLTGFDFQRVSGVVELGEDSFENTVLYLPAWNSSERLAMSGHGLKEACYEENRCHRSNATCRFNACKLKDIGAKKYGVVHVVRNPLEMLLSGYIYHREMGPTVIERGLELWLKENKSDILPENIREKVKGLPYYKVLQELNFSEGIRAEFLVNGEEVFRAARNYRDLKDRSEAINIHFEDLKRDYQVTLQKVFEAIKLSNKVPMIRLLEVASIHNVERIPKEMIPFQVDAHMTKGKFDKKVLRQQVYEDKELSKVLDFLAKKMDYDSI